MPSITLFYIFLTALFTVLVMIPSISKLAVGIGIMDRIDARKVHTLDTPRLGGIAIFFAFMLAVILFGEFSRQTRGFLSGAIIIFLTGLIDDIVGLTPQKKLVGQIMAALAATTIGGLHIKTLGNLFGWGETPLGHLGFPLTILAIVGIINAINLLDGLDGLAGGVTTIATTAFAIIAFLTGNSQLIGLTVALLGAITGFLKFNTYPARIFMGDSGSLFLGYSLGIFSAIVVEGSFGRVAATIPFIILSIPVLDTLYVMFSRMRSGKNIFHADRTHVHHRFLDFGFSHKATVTIVYSLTYCFSVLAILLIDLPEKYLLSVSLLISVLFVLTAAVGKHFPGPLNSLSFERLLLRSNSQSLMNTSHSLLLCSKYTVIAILSLALLLPPVLDFNSITVAALLLALSISLLFMTKDWGNHFLHFVLYFNGAFLIYLIENQGREKFIAEISLNTVSHGLFFILFFICGIEMFIRVRSGELKGSPLEYLLLFIVISIPFLPADFIAKHHLYTVGSKSVILFTAYKQVLMDQANRNRKIIVTTLGVLLIAVLKGLYELYWAN